MAASAEALLLFVPVAGDAAASSVAVGLRQKAAIGAVKNDGGYNASAVNQRADAPDAGRADRSLRPDHQRPAGYAGRLGQPANRAHQPAQHSQRAGAARSDAVITCKTLPVRTGGVRAWDSFEAADPTPRHEEMTACGSRAAEPDEVAGPCARRPVRSLRATQSRSPFRAL
jgi:hypothetical protein